MEISQPYTLTTIDYSTRLSTCLLLRSQTRLLVGLSPSFSSHDISHDNLNRLLFRAMYPMNSHDIFEIKCISHDISHIYWYTFPGIYIYIYPWHHICFPVYFISLNILHMFPYIHMSLYHLGGPL